MTTVLFVFPPYLPVTGTNMNYCIVAFAFLLIISTIQWFVDGRKNYKGPYIEPETYEGGVPAEGALAVGGGGGDRAQREKSGAGVDGRRVGDEEEVDGVTEACS
jgi:hypothetical protein